MGEEPQTHDNSSDHSITKDLDKNKSNPQKISAKKSNHKRSFKIIHTKDSEV